MTNFKISNSKYHECLEILRRTKEKAAKIIQGVSLGESPSKGRIDEALTKKSRSVEDAKLECEKYIQELECLLQQAASGRSRVTDITGEYEVLLEENESLQKTESMLIQQGDYDAEDIKLAEELRRKLQLLKKVTGVRFDFNAPEDLISGYVGIKGNIQNVCNVVPFIIKKNEGNITELLWDKISEAATVEDDKEN